MPSPATVPTAAVQLVRLVLDHYYYEPSLIAEALQMP